MTKTKQFTLVNQIRDFFCRFPLFSSISQLPLNQQLLMTELHPCISDMIKLASKRKRYP